MRKPALLCLSLFLLLVSCKNNEEKVELFGFLEAQPDGVKNLEQFPNRLLGKYISPEDSTVLTIRPTIIERTSDFSGMIHLRELDSLGSFNGHFLFVKNSTQKVPAEKIGDSLRFHLYDTDTIINLNTGDVVKKFKGSYFLNSLQDASHWTVKKLRLKKGTIIINSLDSVQDFDKLKKIRESSVDTVAPKYTFKPTKKEFKSFATSDGFGSGDRIYIKLD